MSKRDERKAWVAGLKVGDEVAATETGDRGVPNEDAIPRKATVAEAFEIDSRYPSGSIMVAIPLKVSARPFNALGLQTRAFGYGDTFRIDPITDEHRDGWRADDVLKRLRGNLGNWGRPSWLTVDQLLRIGAILDEVKETGK